MHIDDIEVGGAYIGPSNDGGTEVRYVDDEEGESTLIYFNVNGPPGYEYRMRRSRFAKWAQHRVQITESGWVVIPGTGKQP